MYHSRLLGIGIIFLMLSSGCLQNNQANVEQEDNLLNTESKKREIILFKYGILREKLGNPGVYSRVAKAILQKTG